MYVYAMMKSLNEDPPGGVMIGIGRVVDFDFAYDVAWLAES